MLTYLHPEVRDLFDGQDRSAQYLTIRLDGQDGIYPEEQIVRSHFFQEIPYQDYRSQLIAISVDSFYTLGVDGQVFGNHNLFDVDTEITTICPAVENIPLSIFQGGRLRP